MSQYSIIPHANIVVNDGISYDVPHLSEDTRFTDVNAVQIQTETKYIHIEYTNGTPVNWEADISEYQDVIDYVDSIINTITEPSLDIIKTEKKQEISYLMEMELRKGYLTNNILMDATLNSIQRLQSIYQIAAISKQTTLDIVDYHNILNEQVPLSTVSKIIVDLGQNYQTLFSKKQQLRQLVNLAETSDEVQKIVW